MQSIWADPNVSAYFSALGLENDDARTLFNLIDVEGEEEIGVDAFLEGCARYKGEARNIDMHMVLNESKSNSRHIPKVQRKIDKMYPTLAAIGHQVYVQHLANKSS